LGQRCVKMPDPLKSPSKESIHSITGSMQNIKNKRKVSTRLATSCQLSKYMGTGICPNHVSSLEVKSR